MMMWVANLHHNFTGGDGLSWLRLSLLLMVSRDSGKKNFKQGGSNDCSGCKLTFNQYRVLGKSEMGKNVKLKINI